jgi:hypothetical protein
MAVQHGCAAAGTSTCKHLRPQKAVTAGFPAARLIKWRVRQVLGRPGRLSGDRIRHTLAAFDSHRGNRTDAVEKQTPRAARCVILGGSCRLRASSRTLPRSSTNASGSACDAESYNLLLLFDPAPRTFGAWPDLFVAVRQHPGTDTPSGTVAGCGGHGSAPPRSGAG